MNLLYNTILNAFYENRVASAASVSGVSLYGWLSYYELQNLPKILEDWQNYNSVFGNFASTVAQAAKECSRAEYLKTWSLRIPAILHAVFKRGRPLSCLTP